MGNIDFEGDMKTDTEGSDFIRKILLDQPQSCLLTDMGRHQYRSPRSEIH